MAAPAGAGLLDTASADKGFELRLAAATDGRGGGSQEVVMTQAGPVELGCHVHSVMRGHIYVADTPWVAKTDSNGNATLGDVPEGAAQVRVWHGDQLLPTAPLAVNVLATTTREPAHAGEAARQTHGAEQGARCRYRREGSVHAVQSRSGGQPLAHRLHQFGR